MTRQERLTKAQPTVAEVVSFDGREPKELLRIAACLEEHFPHSMAKAVVKAAKEQNLVHEELHSKVEYIVAHGMLFQDRRKEGCDRKSPLSYLRMRSA